MGYLPQEKAVEFSGGLFTRFDYSPYEIKKIGGQYQKYEESLIGDAHKELARLKKEEIIKSIDVRLEKSVIGGGPVSLQSPDQAAEKKDITEISVRINFESDSRKIKSYLEMTTNNFNGYGINAGVTWLLSSDIKNPDGGWFVSMDVSKTKKTMKGSRENCRSGEFEGCETLYFGLGYRL